MNGGRPDPDGHDLSSLRGLGTVGEPINPEAWIWYHEVIGGERCPIVDTWWQTETGAMMIAPLPGVTTTRPGTATHPLPGISAELVDDEGNPVAEGGGYLTITEPWPSMLRGIWGDEQRYVDTYWRSEEHTSELQSLMRISYAVFCLKKKKNKTPTIYTNTNRDIYPS